MSLSVLNQMYGGGLTRTNMFVMGSNVKEPKGLSYIKRVYGVDPIIRCDYGLIKFNPSYDRRSYSMYISEKGLEVDVEFDHDLAIGYSLRVSLYKDDVIVAYRSDICMDLNQGVINNCNTILSNFMD